MTTQNDNSQVTNNLNQPEETDKGEEVKYAYVVGVKNNGQFVFDVHGETIGLVELLGLHSYAQRRIQSVFDDNHGTGDAIAMQNYRMLSELLKRAEESGQDMPEVSTTAGDENDSEVSE